MNNKGQFSIIAALLVAVVLIAAVMTTYSAIRYSPVQGQPQILSAVDETNQALKQLLGFTVGYYGSVLKVTGNVTYAQQLAKHYLESGIENMGSIKPEWGLSLNNSSPILKVNWFTNDSFSQGNMTVTYDLNGLGITGISYSASSRLEVQVSNGSSPTQAQFKVLTDDNEPLINLGTKNIKFYHYAYGNLTWDFSIPTNIISHGDGTYLVDLPAGVSSNSYVVQVEDTRGLSVLASSFSEFTTAITWNSTSFKPDLDFVDTANLNVSGTHSAFNAQQAAPDGVFDTLTEAASGTTLVPSYPTNYNLLSSTTWASGPINYLQVNDNNYMSFHSYGSSFSGSAIFGYNTTGGSTNTIDTIRGSKFTINQTGLATNITASLNSNVAFKAKAAIYSGDGVNQVGTTEEKIFNSANGWVTFNFVAQPILTASTDYVLVVWANSSSVTINRDTGTAERFEASGTYPNWPTTIADRSSQRTFSIYCTFSPASQYTAKVELTGNTTMPLPWNDLVWTIDGSASTNGVSATFQLYNSATGQYPTNGDGYMTNTLGPGDLTKPQTIVTNPANFLNSSGFWKVNITAVKSTTIPFDLNIDLVQYSPDVTNYAINLQEQWLNVNATNTRQDLCIKTGTMGSEPLLVQVLHSGLWQNLMTLTPNYFNNVSLIPYIDSATLSIRFVGSNDLTDPTPDTWNIDSVYLKDERDISFLLNLQQPTFTLELLQNGTMRWLGQNMQLTTQTLPIPPIPVKAIHVNQTINGLNQQVAFQIEDWVSNYQIPLGLTSNSTVFGNRQMIVFQLNSKVSDFTIWWDGNDDAIQTPLAFTNHYFTDTVSSATLNNGKQKLQFSATGFTLTSTVGSVISTAKLMRVNTQEDGTDPELTYVIYNGVVRDIVLGEAEFSGGILNCPNTYTNIVITLPADVTYYTYQLRLMFINSVQARTVLDLCPIRVSTNVSPVQTQTENGTLAGYPILQNGTGTFLNTGGGSWSAHHFSQFISDNGKGAGIMFTDAANQRLYAFDSIAGSSTGALKPSSALIELLPVSAAQASFQYPFDITWQGAVVTFDGNTPVCSLYDGTTPTGLWILSEYPPTLTVTAKS